MKPYPSTMKEKKRYLSFEIVGERKVQRQEAMKAILSSVFGTLGTAGAARAGFALLDLDEATGKGILRCTNKEVGNVRFGLILLTKIGSVNAFVHVTGVSGTIKKAR